MKAIRYDRFGGPEELKLVDMPDPEPGPDDVLIEVHAVSVVPGDWKLRKGQLTAVFPVRPPKRYMCVLLAAPGFSRVHGGGPPVTPGVTAQLIGP